MKRKLNIYLYNALKKAIYKPAGFFKGVIFPMAENLSTKEANNLAEKKIDDLSNLFNFQIEIRSLY